MSRYIVQSHHGVHSVAQMHSVLACCKARSAFLRATTQISAWRLPVCQSVTLVHCVKPTHPTITQFSLRHSPRSLATRYQFCSRSANGITPNEHPKTLRESISLFPMATYRELDKLRYNYHATSSISVLFPISAPFAQLLCGSWASCNLLVL